MDPFYYDSELPLSKFDDPEAVLEDAMETMSGENLKPDHQEIGKPRRRQPKTEKQLLFKEAQKLSNRECLICKEITDKKLEEVFQTRYACKKEDGLIAPSLRIHLKCLKEGKYSKVACKSCKTEVLLPAE